MGNEQTNLPENGEWVKQVGGNFWKPTVKGEQVVGTVVEVIDDQKFGTQYIIKNAAGEKIKLPAHKVLQNRMSEAIMGTEVKIVYCGQEQPTVRGNKPMEMYDVFFKAKKAAGGNPSPAISHKDDIEAFL